uniref:IAA-amino acid hydrolase ILR1-like 5 n=1 Tax=Tanacetum cinerariifolium TaxID=118510 RepID=A0A699GIQ5_TANCI|nr:IAA-amino acid hydrolase ILR1-like 5 [Tanacetum cinerariifolium]
MDQVDSMLLDPEGVKIYKKVMTGEDFAFYQEVIPGMFFPLEPRYTPPLQSHILMTIKALLQCKKDMLKGLERFKVTYTPVSPLLVVYGEK